MRKVLFCLVLSLTIAMFSASGAQASLLLHEAVYHWQDGGTIVTELTPTIQIWKVGNPVGWRANGQHVFSGNDEVEVREKVFDNTEELGATYPAYDIIGRFNWTVTNDDFGTFLYSFHVPTMGVVALANVTPAGWTFSQDGSYFTWTASDEAAAMETGGGERSFAAIVPTTIWSITPGAVDTADGTWYNEDGTWVTSHPGVPEPSSMLLLGMGLFGLGGAVRRRRFKA